MSSTAGVHLSAVEGLAFELRFEQPDVPPLRTDAGPPLGNASGPDSEQLLVAAVANCLSASLLVALRKYRNDDVAVTASAGATLERNEKGRLRVERIHVEIRLSKPAAGIRFLDRALAQYEDFCTVTQSVRAAIPVDVRVVDGDGRVPTGGAAEQ